MSPAKEGDMRVWWIQNVPNDPAYYPVLTPNAAKKVLENLANRDLALGEEIVFSNAGGLQVFEGGEWVDWWSDDGQDIDEWEPEVLDHGCDPSGQKTPTF